MWLVDLTTKNWNFKIYLLSLYQNFKRKKKRKCWFTVWSHLVYSMKTMIWNLERSSKNTSYRSFNPFKANVPFILTLNIQTTNNKQRFSNAFTGSNKKDWPELSQDRSAKASSMYFLKLLTYSYGEYLEYKNFVIIKNYNRQL